MCVDFVYIQSRGAGDLACLSFRRQLEGRSAPNPLWTTKLKLCRSALYLSRRKRKRLSGGRVDLTKFFHTIDSNDASSTDAHVNFALCFGHFASEATPVACQFPGEAAYSQSTIPSRAMNVYGTFAFACAIL